MRVAVAIDNRFVRKDGVVYDTYTQDRSFWDDYLAVFDEVVIAGRVRDVPALPQKARPTTGERVAFHALPYWEGGAQFVRNRAKVRARLADLVETVDAAILRVPGLVGATMAKQLRARGIPYAVEVVEEPRADRPILDVAGRTLDLPYALSLRSACAGAAAASYVTERFLQERYPAPRARVVAQYSSIRLPRGALAPRPRRWSSPPASPAICHVGAMMHPRKGQADLVRLADELHRRGVAVTTRFAGDGPLRPGYERLARACREPSRFLFLGDLPRDAVFRDVLDGSDAMVLTTRGEGLPRAALEAMARGLPVFAYPTAGLPEVLDGEALLPRSRRRAADVLERRLRDPDWLSAQSARNLKQAEAFVDDVLRPRRIGFYRAYAGVVAEARAWTS